MVVRHLMAKILLLYGSTEGYTSTIAAYVAQMVRANGHEVDLRKGSELPSGFGLEGFDGVIVGASVHYGEHQEYVRNFVKDNLTYLESVPSAFFSVRGQVQNKEYLEKFTQETGWKPEQVATIGGAAVKGYEYDSFFLNQVMRFIYLSERILYSLNPLIRLIFKREVSLTRRDGLVYLAFTNWEEIKHFTERFLQRLSRSAG